MNNETNKTHTPGPWRIGMRPGPIVYGAKGEQVADLTARLVADDEMRGNIRLITAAPDLFAALREIVAAVEVGEVDGYAPSGDWYKDARAALDKATGTTTPTPKD